MLKANIGWILTLFGTAVGAGILFLPLQASTAGILILIFVCAISLPAVYFAHKNIGVIMVESKANVDYTGAVSGFLGKKPGFWMNILFFITFFLLLIVYSSGLNSEIGEFLFLKKITTYDLAQEPFLSLLVLSFLIFIIRIGEKVMLRFMSFITFILVFMLLAVSFYLIPQWSSSIFDNIFELKGSASSFLELFPIFILSFSYYPAMSSMIIAFKNQGLTKRQALDRTNGIILISMFMLLFFIMFFVISCVLSLNQAELENAFKNNLSVLTVLSENNETSVLSYAGPLISLLALTTSFVGTFLGARESIRELMKEIRMLSNKNPKGLYKFLAFDDLLLIGFLAVIWAITILHLPILDILGEIVSPPIAFFLFVLPTWITYRIKRLKPYRSLALIFSLAMGILMLFSYVVGKLI